MPERQVCPECGSTQIRPKTRRNSTVSREYDTDYDCNHCAAHFDEPDTATVDRRGPTSGLAGQLATLGEHGEGDPIPRGGA
jgi:predicted RNA-binding Zn-ribbon protein involved in translation (DUF1610 family)